MSLPIQSVDELVKLAEKFKLKIKNTDDLQDLLLIVNQFDGVSDEIYKEWLDTRERRLEKQREQEHIERMRALELGFEPTVAQAQAKIAKSNAETAGWVATVVPLGLAGIAVGGTALVIEHLASTTLLLIALAIIWGTCSLTALTALLLSQFLLRHRGSLGRTASERVVDEESKIFATSIKEPEMELESRSYM